MKKNLLVVTMFAFGALLINGCGSEDTLSPVVTLKGDASKTIDLHGDYTEEGATATDDKTNNLTITTTGSPDKDKAAVYTVTYSATDEAGNVGKATRTVIVRHTASTTAGSYAASDQCSGAPTTFTDVITADANVANRLKTTKFGNYANADVYFDISGETNSTVTVPTQMKLGAGTAPNVADREFSGTGNVSSDGKTIIINYTEKIGTATTTCTTTYTKP